MALVSPPKPWQRTQPDPIQQPATPITAPNNATQPQAQQNATTLSPTPTLSQPCSFGYGQSCFGYSPSSSYMTPSYGGSGYGGSYNGMYGHGGSYGSSFGSAYSPMYNQWGIRPYGSMPFGNQLDAYKGTPVNLLINSGHAFMSGIQHHVSTFGRFSQILHMNLDALQMSFSSVVQLLTNASMLRHELAAFFGAFGSIRAVYLLYQKIRHVILNLLGRKFVARNLEFEGLWKDSGQGRWGWMPTFLTLSLSLLIIRRLIQFLTSRQSGDRWPEPQPMDPSEYWRPSPPDNGSQWMPPYSSPSSPQPYSTPLSPNSSSFNCSYFPQYGPSQSSPFPNGLGVPDF